MSFVFEIGQYRATLSFRAYRRRAPDFEDDGDNDIDVGRGDNNKVDGDARW